MSQESKVVGDVWPSFTINYRYDDSNWGINFHAESFEDAKARLNAICLNGTINGQILADRCFEPPVGFFAKLKYLFSSQK